MARKHKIGKSIFIGWLGQILLLVPFFIFESKPPSGISNILGWNFLLVRWWTGPQPLLGYDKNGQPMYEGTPADIFFFAFAVLIGLIVYPLIVFLIFSVIDWRRNKTFR